MSDARPARVTWVLLSYRVPREPSTPRIAIWRALKRLGVAQLGDGLVALPADARTQEQLEWVSGAVVEAGGSATLWTATMTSRAQERRLIADLASARAAEYAALRDKIHAMPPFSPSSRPSSERTRTLATLRRELRQVIRRDFFPPPERDQVKAMVESLSPLPANIGTDTNAAAPDDVAGSHAQATP